MNRDQGGLIARTTLPEEIRRQLREQILSGELAPGKRITEQGIAASMGTSAGPVREEFAALTYEGLLIAFPHRGTFVSSVSEQEARSAYEIRARLEPYAAQLLLEQQNPAALAELREIVAELRSAAGRGDYAAMIPLDMRFHGVFYTAAGDSLLAAIWPLLEGVIRKFIMVAGPHYDRDLMEIVTKHEQLVDLVAARDIKTLQRELAGHASGLLDSIRDSREARPD